MNFLITGGSGFVGKNLYKKIKENEDDNSSIVSLSSNDADLRDSSSLKKYNHIKFDKIYHLATWHQAGDFSLKHPGEQWINNQLINTNLLNWWLSHQKQAKLISMGTSCCYEENGSLEEEDYLKGVPTSSLFAYAMCKRMLYIGQQNLAKQFGLKYLTLVPSTLYGPGYSIKNKIPHFIFDIIKKILIAKKENNSVELWGDGTQKRELMHIEDFLNNLLFLENIRENELINIGAGKEFEIKHFAEIVCEIADFDFKKIYFNKDKYTGAKTKNLSIKKIKKIIPNYDQKPLYEGLKETIEDLKLKI